MSDLNKKIDHAIKLLRLIPTDTEPAELCYSGGKDSDVILRLAQMAGIKYRAIYKNTTIDPKGTKKHCIDNGVEIINPKLSFFKIVEQRGMPSRWARYCCSTLKEYKILDNQIIGIRREESRKRAERYQEPTVCRNYGKSQHVEQYLPILDWTLADIAEFVERESNTRTALLPRGRDNRFYTSAWVYRLPVDVAKKTHCGIPEQPPCIGCSD